MSVCRTIILLTVLALCSFHTMGQDTNYVYQDTALLYEDSVEAAKSKGDILPVGEDDSNVKEDYTGDTILRQNELFVEPDSIRKLKNSESFAYAKNLDSLLYEKKNQSAEKEDLSWLARLLLSSVTKYFLLIVAVTFIVFILYKLFFTEGFFQRPPTVINVAALPEDDNLSATADYGKLIAQAINSRNYRMAVRYHYLQSLQRLSSKGAIQFEVDKTNFQYVRELSGKKYKNSFASLTLDYEYVWYGGFEIDEHIFNSIQNKFKLFNSEV